MLCDRYVDLVILDLLIDYSRCEMDTLHVASQQCFFPIIFKWYVCISYANIVRYGVTLHHHQTRSFLIWTFLILFILIYYIYFVMPIFWNTIKILLMIIYIIQCRWTGNGCTILTDVPKSSLMATIIFWMWPRQTNEWFHVLPMQILPKQERLLLFKDPS